MKKLLFATVACCLFATGANACGGVEIPKACYSRVYDVAHLAKHPDQTVSAMRFSDSDTFDFDIGVQFRGSDKWWDATGICNDFGPGMICGVILDGCEPTGNGRHFYITYNKNRTSLYLYPKNIILDTTLDEATERSAERILTEGKDDKVFKLDKTVCQKKKQGKEE
jgi:hypothetical protein